MKMNKLNADQQFWLIFWVIVASVLITLITSLSVVHINEDIIRKEMVDAGVDPIAAMCSMRADRFNRSVCASYIMKKGKNLSQKQ